MRLSDPRPNPVPVAFILAMAAIAVVLHFTTGGGATGAIAGIALAALGGWGARGAFDRWKQAVRREKIFLRPVIAFMPMLILLALLLAIPEGDAGLDSGPTGSHNAEMTTGSHAPHS